jgi:hypothetical protein
MAAEDTERYKGEMQIYNGRQEAKMRSEALKPPVAFQGGPGAAPVDSRAPQGYGGVPPGAMEAARGGYPEQMANMSAFANPGAAAAMGAGGYNPYGGMDFAGYGAAMGAYGMSAYGGAMGAYGMGGAQDAMAQRAQMEAAQQAYGGAAGGAYGAMMGGGFQGGMMGYG